MALIGLFGGGEGAGGTEVFLSTVLRGQPLLIPC